MENQPKSKLTKQVILFVLIFAAAFFGTRFVMKKFVKPIYTHPAAVESAE